jgi:surface antigen
MHSRIDWRHVRAGLAVLAGAAAVALAMPASTAALAAGRDDFPYRGTVNVADPWGFYSGYCTSFAAFRLSQEGVVFHHASLTGPNGKTAFFGNGGSWDAAAAAIGYRVDTHPSVGAIAVWHGGEDHAWWGGHVAYVMAVDAASRATVEEYNWTSLYKYDQRVVQAPRYIHFEQGHAAATPAATTRAAGHPYATTHVLNERAGPSTTSARVGQLSRGARIMIVCQSRSHSVINGSAIWDRLDNGAYVADFYTTTPAFNRFSPGLSAC